MCRILLMGITERREREKKERRKTILNCAKELILSQGVERVSMMDIADKAELSKATMYLYFSGKEDILNEICEESAQAFMEHFKPFFESGITGMKALKCFWRVYVELFGSSDEMIIVFKVRNYFNSWQTMISLEEQSKFPYVDTILESIKTIIDQCITEGVFDPNLDSALATRLILLMFSNTVDNATRMPPEDRKSPAYIEGMAKAFQVIIYGFAKEGIDRSFLDITGD